MKTKICPKCGAEHSIDIDYCGCGHRWKAKSVQSLDNAIDPLHGCCEVRSSAGRCHYPGVHNDSTNGGGSWICSKHYKDNERINTDSIIEQSHIDVPNADYSKDSRRQLSYKAFRKDLIASKHINEFDKKRISDGIAAMVKQFNWKAA